MGLIFVKLGGSLITDKSTPETPRPDVIRRLAEEVRRALERRPDLRVLLGHGSGSFGHVVGQKYNLREGIASPRGWEGYVRTAAAAARLHHIVVDLCLEVGLWVVSLPPSASAWCVDGRLVSMDTRPHRTLLSHGVIPLVYGDVALDKVRGATIVSTEEVFAHLARAEPALRPEHIILVGNVDGVYTADPHREPSARPIPHLTPEEALQLSSLGGSHGIDVTGGMAGKVREMALLARALPGLTVHILSGQIPGALEEALLCPDRARGTRIGPASPTPSHRPNNPVSTE